MDTLSSGRKPTPGTVRPYHTPRGRPGAAHRMERTSWGGSKALASGRPLFFNTSPTRIFDDRDSLDREPAGEQGEVGGVRPDLLVRLPAGEFPPKDLFEEIFDNLLDLLGIVAGRNEKHRPFGDLLPLADGLVLDAAGFEPAIKCRFVADDDSTAVEHGICRDSKTGVLPTYRSAACSCWEPPRETIAITPSAGQRLFAILHAAATPGGRSETRLVISTKSRDNHQGLTRSNTEGDDMTATRLPVLLALFLMQVVAEKALLPLLNFAAPEAAQSWQAVNDGVMGGVSSGRFRITDDRTLEFSGMLSLENNGGFASVRTKPTDLGIEAGDTIVVRVRGDGRAYVLNLYTRSRRMAFSYRAPLPTTKDEWTEVRVPLADFIPTAFGRRVQGMGPVEPDQINGLGFMLSDKKAGPFRLEVEWVKRQEQ